MPNQKRYTVEVAENNGGFCNVDVAKELSQALRGLLLDAKPVRGQQLQLFDTTKSRKC